MITTEKHIQIEFSPEIRFRAIFALYQQVKLAMPAAALQLQNRRRGRCDKARGAARANLSSTMRWPVTTFTILGADTER